MRSALARVLSARGPRTEDSRLCPSATFGSPATEPRTPAPPPSLRRSAERHASRQTAGMNARIRAGRTVSLVRDMLTEDLLRTVDVTATVGGLH